MRESYLQMRRKNGIDLQWCYQYYAENTTGSKMPFKTFSNAFQIFLQVSDVNVLKHLDRVFEVHILEDKEGKEIWFA